MVPLLHHCDGDLGRWMFQKQDSASHTHDDVQNNRDGRSPKVEILSRESLHFGKVSRTGAAGLPAFPWGFNSLGHHDSYVVDTR